MFLNIFDGGELPLQFHRQIAGDAVFTHANRFAHILQGVFRNKVVFAFAQEQANGWLSYSFFKSPSTAER